MKTFSAVCVLVLVGFSVRAQSPGTPVTAVITGKVVNSVTGEPLRKAEITLSDSKESMGFDAAMRMFGGDTDPSAAPAPPEKSTKVLTDGNGEFRIERIESGDHYLRATHAGYIDGEYTPESGVSRQGAIHITASGNLTGIVFRLIPFGAVSGRVLDEDGDPVSGATVTALSSGRAPGNQLLPADTSPVNDRGEFRLGKIPPGRYYLSASLIRMDFMSATPPPPAEGSPETNYVTTYYPGTVDVTAATKIDVAAGADLTGMTIALRKSRVVRVRGHALAADGTPLRAGQVMLTSVSTIGSMQMSALRTDGSFEIANVQPGSYMLMSVQMNGRQPSIQMQPLVVPKEGLSDVKLRVQPEQTIQGKVVVVADKKVPLKGVMVMLMADEGMAVMPSMGSVSETGAFSLRVSGAAYRLQVPSTPPGTYLKSVVLNGREMLGKALDFSAGGSGELTLTFGIDGAKIDALVTTDGSKPAPEATVVLVPSDPARRSEATARDGDADSNGHLTLNDVPPGDYLAFAWKNVDSNAWLDADFLKPLERNAKRVTISPNGSQKLELLQTLVSP